MADGESSTNLSLGEKKRLLRILQLVFNNYTVRFRLRPSYVSFVSSRKLLRKAGIFKRKNIGTVKEFLHFHDILRRYHAPLRPVQWIIVYYLKISGYCAIPGVTAETIGSRARLRLAEYLTADEIDRLYAVCEKLVNIVLAPLHPKKK